MTRQRTRSTTYVLSVGLVLTLLVLSSGLASAQPRSITALFVQEAKLTASDGAAEDYFGSSVSISGDTMVVGASGDDDHGGSSGSAYVFERDAAWPGNWSQVAKLTISDGAEWDSFGSSVSIGGDTVVVGATYDDPGGSAYLFEKPVAGWTDMFETVKLIASDGAEGDRFGTSMSISGDTVVVGAPADDGLGYDSGSAYVFERDVEGQGNWGQVAKLTASDGGAYERFGGAVSISGDTVVVGAAYDDGIGAAYLFEKPEGGWIDTTETTKITASDGVAQDRFGVSVSLGGGTMVVCTSPYGDDSESSGAAYVFERDAGGSSDWGQVAKLTASDGVLDDLFGYSVSTSGAFVVVGAKQNDDNGSAYLFQKPGAGWADMNETAKLTASDGAPGDWFGNAVAVSGDTVVASALLDDDEGEDSGSAYVFGSREPVTWVYLPLVLRSSP